MIKSPSLSAVSRTCASVFVVTSRVRTLASFAALAATGCATASSAGMPTNQIKPALEVKVDASPAASETYLSAVLEQPGSLSRVQLAPGDTLTASSDKDAQIALSYDGMLQIFTAHLPKITDRATITFSLARSGGSAGATATVQLPAALALTSPTNAQQVSYAGGAGSAKLAWSNAASGPVHFFTYPCGAAAVATRDLQAPDSGSFSLPATALVASAPPASGQCVTIRIQRQAIGTVDAGFAPGSKLVAMRFDYVNVNVVP